MSGARALRVVIADDHPVYRDGLKTILEAEADIEVVAEAGDGREAIARFKEHRPDLVLLDLRMPRMDGVDAAAAILRLDPAARILVLTTFDGDEDIHRALAAGAKAYLLKEAPRAEIVQAIRAVLADRKYVAPQAAERLAERAQGRDLTDREIQVLEEIARGRSNKEAGDALSISEATVKAHVNSILGKLGAADRTQAVVIALRRGIVRLD
jgi:two-component system NarL family response regulator